MNDQFPMTNVFHRQPKGSAYGVPALAGRMLPFESSSTESKIHDETASDRLKRGLHAPQTPTVSFIGHRSLDIGHWSFIGHWSLVIGHFEGHFEEGVAR
jgi:hypothetical protein